mmetsp:Transcript_77416/g.155125  ORF Transcript_77416/g.155125 Transcript_77416/m.155125 type:complete len:137 (-) Transcript_77416:885-1295(-)|eukprot:CAMPEP_0171632920 /NCGR_PEP_ID=MMETSP0990-20121206/24814_1 /TAXON_ID=483369 /ORGANISM="non described non described, Strain CCMP2098" /LENGTH=136 /DNA_ID=CAMNT_0012203377 /DNA_START=262 /DNA_END=672 /DNA_ORIENTATION=+
MRLFKGTAVCFDEMVDREEQSLSLRRQFVELPVLKVEGSMLGGKVKAATQDGAVQIRSDGLCALGESLNPKRTALLGGLGLTTKILKEKRNRSRAISEFSSGAVEVGVQLDGFCDTIQHEYLLLANSRGQKEHPVA